MNRRLKLFCALVTCIAVVSLAGDAVCQQKHRRRNKPSEPIKTNNLSRGRAADLIKAYPEFKSTFDNKILVGRIWEDGWGGNVSSDLQLLMDEGLLTITKTGQKQFGRFTEYLVELTPKGEIEAKVWAKTTEKVDFDSLGLVSSNVTVYHVVVAEKQLIEVTGIAMNEGGKTGRAEFTWRWAPTAHAKLSKQVPSDEVKECSAYFQLYDDGWRVVEPYGKGICF
jgi:hypothetical protein